MILRCFCILILFTILVQAQTEDYCHKNCHGYSGKAYIDCLNAQKKSIFCGIPETIWVLVVIVITVIIISVCIRFFCAIKNSIENPPYRTGLNYAANIHSEQQQPLYHTYPQREGWGLNFGTGAVPRLPGNDYVVNPPALAAPSSGGPYYLEIEYPAAAAMQPHHTNYGFRVES